jgi:hypothetical protein
MKARLSTGGPRDLLPATRAALFVGLADAPDVARRKESWTSGVVRQVVDNRLAGHALEAIDQLDVEVDDTTIALLERSHREQMFLSMRLNAVASQLQHRLREIGIDSLVIKGAGLSDIDPDGPTRFFGDVDLLVRPSDFKPAIAHYRDAGFAYEHPSPWNRLFAKSVNLQDDAGRAVDMQRALAPWCWMTRIGFDDLWSRSRLLDDGTRTLSREDALIVAAMSQVADFGDDHEKLVPWRDLALLAGQVDVERLTRIARDARIAGVVATMLDALPTPLGNPALIAALGGPHIPLAKVPRWRVLNERTLARRYWAVRVTRNLPMSKLIPGLALLPVLPPDEQRPRDWLSHVVTAPLRRGQRPRTPVDAAA